MDASNENMLGRIGQLYVEPVRARPSAGQGTIGEVDLFPTCLFCSTSPEDAWATSEYGIAIPAHQPLTPGHVVVAPHRHVAGFYDLDVEEQHGLWALVTEVRTHVMNAQHVDSTTIGFQDGDEDQGHTHIHVVPRRPGVELPSGIEWVTE
jgi:diadenosine tetraphosphate (Ap4A) HIT family hydrolase